MAVPNPQGEQRQPPATDKIDFSSLALPRLESIAGNFVEPAAKNRSELVQELFPQRLKTLIGSIKECYPHDQVSAQVDGEHKSKAEFVGSMLGTIVADFLRYDLYPSEAILGKLLTKVVGIYNQVGDTAKFLTGIQADAIRDAINTVKWQELFQLENTYGKLANLVSHGALLAAGQGAYYVAYRQDLDYAIAGRADGTGSLFTAIGGWHFSDKLDTHDRWNNALESLAAIKDFKHTVAQRYEYQEFAEYLTDDETRNTLNGSSIEYFPIIFGEIYIGGLYGIVEAANKLTLEQRKDLMLASISAASAFARIARMNNTSNDCAGTQES